MTARTDERARLLQEVADALGALDLDAHAEGDALVVDGSRTVPGIVDRAHPTPADLAAIVDAAPGRLPAMVVADRISAPGRAVLRGAGWGWLDRRGHLRVWAPGVRIEASMPIADGGAHRRRGPADPWTTVGLEIALAALIEPTEPVTARRVAARIGRSVGATHELIARFADLGLVGPKTHRPLLPELFWEAAARWPDDGWIGLPVELAELAERVGPDQLVRVDERAATLGGARIAAVGDLAARAYVASASSLRRARSLADRGAPARSWVRASPVRWLPENEDVPADAAHPWRVAHPIVCALRLAADPSRGREIVEAWGIVPQPEP
ncbi:MAG: hypothetical protein KDA94_10890 [Acidimicrobiales bacterium]|nr:hypothetical protein [Acidimicrobiales bacterium]